VRFEVSSTVLEDFAFLQGHKDAGRPHLAVFGPFGELSRPEIVVSKDEARLRLGILIEV
jgi:hypothetical protein